MGSGELCWGGHGRDCWPVYIECRVGGELGKGRGDWVRGIGGAHRDLQSCGQAVVKGRI